MEIGRYNQAPLHLERFSIVVEDWFRLEPFDPSDALELAALISNNRAHLRYVGMPFEELTAAKIRERIPVTHGAMMRDERVSLGVIYDGVVVGAVSLDRVATDEQVAEAGIWLAEQYGGQGIGSKAMGAIMTWGFKNWEVGTMRLRIHPDNESSLKMAARLGATRVGMMPPAYPPKEGEAMEWTVWEITQGEWARMQAVAEVAR